MTTRLPGQSGGDMVKGLAKPRNRLRHDREVKRVDASSLAEGEGQLLPDDG